MTKDNFIPLEQEDMEETLCAEFQETWQKQAADLLEDCAAKMTKAIRKAQQEHIPDGRELFESGFSRLAYLVRLAYLRGFAEGYCRREDELCTEAETPAELDSKAAFDSIAAEDDFAEYDLDCEVSPKKATKAFLAYMAKQ